MRFAIFKTPSIYYLLSTIHTFLVAVACLLVTAGCTLDMRQQPQVTPLEPSDFFLNGQASRPLIEEAVARGHLNLDTQFYEGKNEDGSLIEVFPLEITPEVMRRGQERYNIFCSPCHSTLGNGQGMIVQRGMKTPPSFHIERLREAPPGYFYDAITNGFGVMYSYASRIPPEDRWAIIAYIKALQLSQNATLDDVPPDQRNKLEEPGQ